VVIVDGIKVSSRKGEAGTRRRRYSARGCSWPTLFLLVHGHAGAAEAACRKALALGPELHETYSNLGVVLLRQGKGREA
jgi:hypothetical protein